MAKYHINSKGDVGVCKAKPGGCPFGGESDHYDSPQDARQGYEKRMADQFSSHAPLSKQTSYASREEKMAVRRILANYSEVIENELEDRRIIEYTSVPVSSEEKAALEHYAAGYNFNSEAYGIPTFEGEPFDHPEVLAHGQKILDSLFERIGGRGKPTVSYRGMRQSDWSGDFEKDFIGQLDSGKITFSGYTSTSKDPEEARYFSYDPRGGKKVFIRMYGTGGVEFEHQEVSEYLYGKNTEWDVVTWGRDAEGNIEVSLKQAGF